MIRNTGLGNIFGPMADSISVTGKMVNNTDMESIS
jgi:hypothetical protein